MEDEEWRPIVGHPGYEVSSHGRVRSLDRVLELRDGRSLPCVGTMLSPKVECNGHLRVTLTGGQQMKIHILVLEAFVEPRPEGMEGCHWDDIPANNHVENLRWGTHSDNMQDIVRNGNHNQLKKTRCPQGHAYTEENTYIAPSRPNARYCRTCVRDRNREHKRRLRAARKLQKGL